MGLGSTLKKYKWILLGVVVAIILSVSVVFGFRYYQYRKTAEYTFGKFQAALISANVPQLAVLVDFRRITEHLASETVKVFPFFQAGPNQIQKISSIYQTQALKQLRQKPEPSEDALVTDMNVLLQKPVYILPPDVVHQLAKNMTLRKGDGNSVVITSHFEHPLFKKSFPVLLSMQNSGEGWIIYDILNAHEMLTSYRTLLEERLQSQRDLVYSKADKLVRTMHETLDIQSCTAQAGLISDKKTLLIVVQLLARNKTGLTIKNVNASTEILNNQNEVLLKRQLSSTEPTPPSSDFSHSWTIELDGTSAEGKRILAGPLSCRAVWRTLTLSNARVYHAETPPKKVGPCPQHSDGHLEGLCTMDIFTK